MRQGAGSTPIGSISVVIDCLDARALADFWTAALHYRQVGGHGAYIRLRPEQPGGVPILLQQVPERRSGKNRVHLDLDVDDIEAEAERLASIGAHRPSPGAREEAGIRWIVMADPEGNEFCVCESEPATAARARS